MQQPSAQGIASLYRGNPAPLQQSIQKEQQAKPGLPPDLQKMLALQIVNNEKDSVTAQKAMDQLQQMNGQQGGKPPTVMQSLEQQAQQKMQAQAVQAQQKQQGIQALMQQAPAGPVPEGTPQPEMQPQPQGIDQSDRVAFAGAEGGIVAFQSRGEVPEEKKYETPYDRMNRENREAEAEAKKRGSDEPLDAQAAADRNALQRILASIKGTSEDAGRAIADVATVVPRSLASAYDTVAVRPMRAAGINAAYLAPKLTPEGASTGSATPFSDVKTAREAAKNTQAQAATATDNRAALNKADAAVRAMPGTPAAPVRDIKELNTQRVNAARPPAPAPVAPPPAVVAPPADSDALAMVKARMGEKPEDREAAAMAKYEKMVGKPDTAQHDRLIAELEKRKQSLAPKQGFEGLMEYLGQVSANSQPGRGSFASGAAGARGMDKLNRERQLEQFELSKQAIEVSQKKLDTVRSYAKETYGIGKSAFDQVYKDQFDAAKEVVKDESAARQLAQQNTLKTFELDQNKTLRREEMRSQEKIAGMRGATSATLTPNQRAEIANKAIDNINATLKANVPLQMRAAKDPAYMQQLVQAETARLMAAAEGRTIPTAPGAGSPGGTSTSGWGKAQVVK
jgi:hypothetical protein